MSGRKPDTFQTKLVPSFSQTKVTSPNSMSETNILNKNLGARVMHCCQFKGLTATYYIFVSRLSFCCYNFLDYFWNIFCNVLLWALCKCCWVFFTWYSLWVIEIFRFLFVIWNFQISYNNLKTFSFSKNSENIFSIRGNSTFLPQLKSVIYD